MNDQVLIVFHQEGDENPVQLALIPLEKLSAYNLDKIHGQEVQEGNCPKRIASQIVELFERTGLSSEWGEKEIETDLKQYLDPKPPYTVSRVVLIGWAT